MDKDGIPSVIDLTPLNPEFNQDPHKLLDKLRSECPVRRDEVAGTFVLTRYADVRGTLSDTTMWRDPQKAELTAILPRRLLEPPPPGLELYEGAGSSILLSDDPDHARVRNPLQMALYKRVAKCRPLVEKVVSGILDRIDASKPFDAMAEFCILVPIDAISRILGVDETRIVEFREWSEGVILSLNPFRTPEQTEFFVACSNKMGAYFRELIAERRKAPKDDLISDMVILQAEGAPLTDGEVQNNLTGLLIGGNLTTTDLIGNGIWLFLKNPEQLAKLKAEPDLINSAVEEILRFESPVDITGRIAPRDMEVGGCPVKQSQSMFMSLRGANRDPEVFKDPHKFDIARKDAPHVAFGGGLHLCIGSPLARLEAQVALTAFFERFPNLRLTDPDAPPKWRSLPFFRGLETLNVVAK